MKSSLIQKTTITCLFDNRSMNPKLQEGWGLSLFIECDDKKILFDTGGCEEAFFFNIEKLSLRLDAVTHVILSHRHWDHIAGLEKVLSQLKPATKVFLPKLFFGHFLKRKYPFLQFTTVSSFLEIDTQISSLVLHGSFYFYEQVLILSTQRGLVLITGCAHPGIITIIKRTKAHFPTQPIHCIIGGLHLYSVSPYLSKEIVQAFQSHGVEKVAPCHCSGDHTIRQFQEAYGKDFLSVATGSVIFL